MTEAYRSDGFFFSALATIPSRSPRNLWRSLSADVPQCVACRPKASCVAAGQTTASVALKRLVACGPRNHFYRAVREAGRVFKTIFILDYLSDPYLRRRVRRGLLKGEQLHALARCVHYGKRGRIDGRDLQQQMSRASCLVLILAAIIYWQIVQIDEVSLSTLYVRRLLALNDRLVGFNNQPI